MSTYWKITVIHSKYILLFAKQLSTLPKLFIPTLVYDSEIVLILPFTFSSSWMCLLQNPLKNALLIWHKVKKIIEQVSTQTFSWKSVSIASQTTPVLKDREKTKTGRQTKHTNRQNWNYILARSFQWIQLMNKAFYFQLNNRIILNYVLKNITFIILFTLQHIKVSNITAPEYYNIGLTFPEIFFRNINWSSRITIWCFDINTP